MLSKMFHIKKKISELPGAQKWLMNLLFNRPNKLIMYSHKQNLPLQHTHPSKLSEIKNCFFK